MKLTTPMITFGIVAYALMFLKDILSGNSCFHVLNIITSPSQGFRNVDIAVCSYFYNVTKKIVIKN